MKQTKTIAFAFLFQDLIPAGLDKEVVQQALAYRDGDGKHSPARRDFDAVVRQIVKINGFRYADQAPAWRLRRRVEENWLRHQALGEAVVGLWADSRPDLREAVRDFLECEEVFPPDLGEDKEQDHIQIPLSRLRELAERFIATEDRFSRDEAALMVCRLLPSIPLPTQAVVRNKRPEKESETDAEMNAADWNRLLETWQELPADAPEWETIEEFIGALRLLAEDKRRERDADVRQLRAAVEALQADFAAKMTFFGVTDVSYWSDAGCSRSEAAPLAERTRELYAALTERAQLAARPVSNHLEARQQREAMTMLEEHIAAECEELAQVFAPDPAPDTPNDDREESVDTPDIDSEDTSKGETFTTPEEIKEANSMPPATEEEEEAADSGGEDAGAETVEAASAKLSAEPEAAFLSTVPDAALPLAFGETLEAERLSADAEAETREPPLREKAARLRPAAEIAVALRERDDEALWASFQWAMIAENDLPGACLLAQSRAAAQRPCPIPDWLLAAVQGAQWLTCDSVGIAADLMQITQDRLPEPDRAQQTLGLAAALRGALLVPDSGFVGWLHAPEGCAQLPEIVAAVADYAKYRRPLRPEDMQEAMAPEQRSEAIRAASRAAANWREDHRRARSIKRARDVWERLMKDKLLPLLDPASDDQRSEAARLIETARGYESHEEAARLVASASHEVHRRKEMDLAGVHRDQLVRDVQEAALLTRRWCERVQRSGESAAQSERIAERAVRLRDTVRRALPGVETALEAICRADPPQSIAAPALCLRRALRRLAQMLESAETDANARSNREWRTHNADGEELSLEAALGRRLLLLPEVPREDDGLPTPDGLIEIAPALRDACAEGRTLAMALAGWISTGDFRFTHPLLTALQEEPGGEQRATAHEDAIRIRRSELNGDIEGTQTKIERALIDGILTDEERAELLAPVVALSPETTENFPRQARLLRDTREQIDAARLRRLETQRRLWEELQASLRARIDAENWKRVVVCIEADFERGEPRVVDERLDRLREARDKGIEPHMQAFSLESLPERRELEEFQKAAPRILEGLEVTPAGLNGALRAVRDAKTWANVLSFGSVPPPRLTEAKQGLESWMSLKKKHPKAAESPDLIEQNLRYLGFSFPPDGRPYVRAKQAGNDWLTVQAHVSAGNLSRPIPQFGSQARRRYDILCLWERPGTEAISARLHELRMEGDNLLVLYLGRLKQRQDLVRLARSRDLALALLDESLLVFLAAEKDTRLRTFLRCALPYAAVNPYTPDKAGAVPDEMFFGREEAARELMNPDGSCLVYGGRQLGKSALLAHVQRQFENPEREQFAWVEDIKRVGDPPLADQPTNTLLRRLREGFMQHGLLSGTTAEKPETILRHIAEVMQRRPHLQVLAMFDEADNFLDADSADNFRIVTELRTLMQRTERRFKVVFAGLHHVQRFQNLPNQPLAHFGSPIQVGPLEPEAAQRLVREPFEALGFRLTDTSTDTSVVSILSYTNYHPGLIQKFCHALLKRLYRSRRTDVPTEVEAADVEAVYFDPEVRRFIRERFDLMLALDERYQAIAWAMICDQMEERDSYARPYTWSQLLELGQTFWPQGFAGMQSYELLGLLDEMCGIGVLVRTVERTYRLRSPNLVRLMGTETDILGRLGELESQARPANDPDSLHAPLDSRANRYHPLTYAQIRAVNARPFGVSLLLASESLGLSVLEQAADGFLPSELSRGDGALAAAVAVPPGITGEAEMVEWLDSCVSGHKQCQHLVAYQSMTGGTPGLDKRIRGALNFCREKERKTAAHRLHILFLLAPGAVWSWLTLPSAIRADLENRLDAVASPHLWNLSGVRQRLLQHEKMHSEVYCRAVLEATGGWPWLLDRLFDACGGSADPRPAAAKIAADLAGSNGLREEFLANLGVQTLAPVRHVFDFLLAEGSSPEDLIVPEMIGGDPPLTEEECAAGEFLRKMACLERDGDLLGLPAFLARLIQTP